MYPSETDGSQTQLQYEVEVNVGGKIAQLGARLINGVAMKYADLFFANFAKALSESAVRSALKAGA